MQSGAVIGIVAETQCRFLKSLTYPQIIDAGLSVTKLGKSSVVYEVGIFEHSEEGKGKARDLQQPSAVGKFVHVYVDSKTHRPIPVPESWREQLQMILRPSANL